MDTMGIHGSKVIPLIAKIAQHQMFPWLCIFFIWYQFSVCSVPPSSFLLFILFVDVFSTHIELTVSMPTNIMNKKVITNWNNLIVQISKFSNECLHVACNSEKEDNSYSYKCNHSSWYEQKTPQFGVVQMKETFHGQKDIRNCSDGHEVESKSI